MIKGGKFKDIEVQFINLSYGDYLVDNKLVVVKCNELRVPCKDVHNVRKINTHRVIEKYVKGLDELDIDNYNKRLDSLIEQNDNCQSLESEFELRKFKQDWTPIYREVQTVSEPLYVEIVETVADTGNKFITSAFLLGKSSDLSLVKYDRLNAYISIIKETLIEYGFVESQDKYNYSKEAKEFTLGNGSIEWVSAFGKRLFRDIKISNNIMGTLDDMLELYRKDRKLIRDTITVEYNYVYNPAKTEDIPVNELRLLLHNSLANMNEVEPKKSTVSSYDKSREILRKAIKMLDDVHNF